MVRIRATPGCSDGLAGTRRQSQSQDQKIGASDCRPFASAVNQSEGLTSSPHLPHQGFVEEGLRARDVTFLKRNSCARRPTAAPPIPIAVFSSVKLKLLRSSEG